MMRDSARDAGVTSEPTPPLAILNWRVTLFSSRWHNPDLYDLLSSYLTMVELMLLFLAVLVIFRDQQEEQGADRCSQTLALLICSTFASLCGLRCMASHGDPTLSHPSSNALVVDLDYVEHFAWLVLGIAGCLIVYTTSTDLHAAYKNKQLDKVAKQLNSASARAIVESRPCARAVRTAVPRTTVNATV